MCWWMWFDCSGGGGAGRGCGRGASVPPPPQPGMANEQSSARAATPVYSELNVLPACPSSQTSKEHLYKASHRLTVLPVSSNAQVVLRKNHTIISPLGEEEKIEVLGSF